MPNRILKESICTSESLRGLTAEEERFFYRLLVACDDFGRFDARLAVLRARCFPLLLAEISEAKVARWLEGLVRAELVRTYVIDGHPYLEVVAWDKHQQVRAKRSKFPAPDRICNQVQADADNSPRIRNPNPDPDPKRESESEARSESTARAVVPLRVDDGFGAFWAAYPVKKDKQAAERAWRKLGPDPPLQARMLEAIRTLAALDSDWRRGFVPHPTTFVNGRRWEDEPKPVARFAATDQTAGNAAVIAAVLRRGQA